MESRLLKQATSYCRLDFTNSVIRKPKALFYSKNIPQKPINFREKTQKKSLKNIKPECINNERKYRQIQCLKNKKESLKKYTEKQTLPNHFSNQKSKTRVNYQNRGIKYLLDSNTLIKPKLHQSLQQQPVRQKLKRNIIEQLKSYQLKKKPAVMKPEQFSTFQYPKNYIQISPRKLIQMNPFAKPNFVSNKEITIHYSPCYRQKMQERQFIQFSQSMKSLQQIKLIPIKRTADTQELIQKQIFQIQKQKSNHIQSLPLIQHKKDKQLVIGSEYAQKFLQLFGEMQIEDEIKQDLVVSKQFEKIKCQSVQLNKLLSSDSSTIIPQGIKQNKMSKQPTSPQLNSSMRNSRSKRQQIINLNQSNQQNLDQFENPKYKTEEKYNLSQENNPQAESQYSIDIIDSVQFHDRCQRAENFKSIISIHSEHGSSSSQADSIIINNHPQQLISSKPIRTLF